VYIFDLDFWRRARNVCDAVSCTTEADAFLTCSWKVFLNTMMIENKTSTCHVDPLDAIFGLSALTAKGQYTGGEFCLPRLGIKFPHLPGNVILL
jgi:hypothetical protein